MITSPLTRPRLGAFLAVFLLTGCLVGTEEDGARARSFSGGVYTDHELGYSLQFPTDWTVLAYDPPYYGILDFYAAKNDGKNARPTAYATHDSIFSDSYTLPEWVEALHGESFYRDSAVIYPPEIRGGVEVIPVDAWDYEDYGTERSRILYFMRARTFVAVHFIYYAAHFDTSAELRALDSSLTFFGTP
jgi:hypothetical protein